MWNHVQRVRKGVERVFLDVAETMDENIEEGRYDLNDRRSGV